MTPVTPEELSGYLDGELSVERAGMVAAELAGNEDLAATFADMQASDLVWRAAAGSARFQPATELIAAAAGRPSLGGMFAVLLPLVVLALLPRLFDAPELTLLANVVALALVLPWIVRMVAAEVADTARGPAMDAAAPRRDMS